MTFEPRQISCKHCDAEITVTENIDFEQSGWIAHDYGRAGVCNIHAIGDLLSCIQGLEMQVARIRETLKTMDFP